MFGRANASVRTFLSRARFDVVPIFAHAAWPVSADVAGTFDEGGGDEECGSVFDREGDSSSAKGREN
jgi:hypothetical protein